MTVHWTYAPDFKLPVLSALTLAMLTLGFPAHALEAMGDEEMSESSGQAIAFLPENFSLRFNGEDGTPDTGYVRLIPVGPNNIAPTPGTNFQKADTYIYGLALSQSNKALGAARTDADLDSRFGRPIESWGTGSNPFQLAAKTQNGVPSFNGTASDVSFVELKAPDFDSGIYTDAGASDAEKSAYNLKAGFYADILKRNPASIDGAAGQFTERLRLNAVWDGFSINGSNLRLFQTLGNSPIAAYNNTLGINAMVRLNSGNGQNVRATVNKSGLVAATRITSPGEDVDGPNAGEGRAKINLFRDRISSQTGTTTWSANPGSVLSIGSRQTGNNIVNDLTTPAIGNRAAPTFKSDEGLKLYNLNVNLPLGQLYQPLIIDNVGNNLVLEITRIPDRQAIYSKRYQQYAPNPGETYTGRGSVGFNDSGVVYSGSTCNFNRCQNAAGEAATHGSITIGSTNYNAATNQTTAYSGEDAYGVSFGSLKDTSKTFNAANPYYSDPEYQRRRRNGRDWDYLTVGGFNNEGTENNEGDWVNHSERANTAWINYGTSVGVPIDAYTPRGGETLYFNNTSYRTSTASANNNLGSVAIDGISINHLKLTTTGAQ